VLFRKSQQYVRRKLENPWFEILYFVVEPSGGAEKNWNMGAQLQTITYKKPQKLFFLIARLNSILLSINGGHTMHYWYYLYKLDHFLWHNVMSYEIFLYGCKLLWYNFSFT